MHFASLCQKLLQTLLGFTLRNLTVLTWLDNGYRYEIYKFINYEYLYKYNIWKWDVKDPKNKVILDFLPSSLMLCKISYFSQRSNKNWQMWHTMLTALCSKLQTKKRHKIIWNDPTTYGRGCQQVRIKVINMTRVKS